MARCPVCGAKLELVAKEELQKLTSSRHSEPSARQSRPTFTEVEAALRAHRGLLEISQAGHGAPIRVMPKFYLGRKFGEIAEIVRGLGGEYRSETDAEGNRRGWWEI